MAAVVFRFAAELRSRWRSWMGIALLAGIFYGAVLAALVGAQRTDTVVARSVQRKLTPDVFLFPAFSRYGELLDFDKIAAFPEVKRALRLPSFFEAGGWDVTGFAHPSLVTRMGRLLDGRIPRPGAVDEAVVNIVGRERRHVRVGSTVELHLAGPGYTGDGDPPPGPSAKVRVVGLVSSLGDFASVASPGLFVTPAFTDRFRERASTTDLYALVLNRRDADIAAFRRHISDLTGGKPVLFAEGRNDWVQVQRSFHIQAQALRALAALLGLVSLFVLTQILIRLGFVESTDHEVLRGLGMTRVQRHALALLRGSAMGAVALTLAVLIAIAGSWLMPFGRPRLAEVSPGPWAPRGLLLSGAAVVLAVVVAQSTLAAWFRRADIMRRSLIAERVAAVVRGAAPGVGVRFALEPGQGVDAVPVRSTVAAATLGVVAVIAALTVSASLGNLLGTPRLYGWGWDVAADLSSAGPQARSQLATTPGVAAVGYGNISGNPISTIGPVSADIISMEPGPVRPVTLDGRAPVRNDEIALARKTLRRAHARVGSYVSVGIQGQAGSRRMRVVGVVVLPVESDTSSLGEGALMSGAGLRSFVPEAQPDTAFVRFERGSNRVTMNRAVAAMAGDGNLQVPSKPTSLVDFGRVRVLPYVLAGILAALAAATLAHLVLSSARRRRHDLAVLKTIGFVSRQLRGVVVWQALTLSAVALIVGVPLGIAGGRWLWQLFANQVGFVGRPVTNTLSLVTVAVAALASACAIASVAGRAAIRTPASVVLRSE